LFRRIHGESYSGAGVGLAIARQIADRHGGRIWFESEPGSGSRFSFSLPKAA
jgi:signal transduction histidine kinase